MNKVTYGDILFHSLEFAITWFFAGATYVNLVKSFRGACVAFIAMLFAGGMFKLIKSIRYRR